MAVKITTADQLVALARLEVREVKLSRTDDVLFLRELAAADDALIAAAIDDKSGEGWLRFLAASICDEQGNLLFSGDDGVAKLRALPRWIIHELIQPALRLNMPTKEEEEAEKKG